EQGGPVAGQHTGRAAQHRRLVAVHVDLHEADVLQPQVVQRHAGDVEDVVVDVPAHQGRHAPLAPVAGGQPQLGDAGPVGGRRADRKSTRLNSSHVKI